MLSAVFPGRSVSLDDIEVPGVELNEVDLLTVNGGGCVDSGKTITCGGPYGSGCGPDREQICTPSQSAS